MQDFVVIVKEIEEDLKINEHAGLFFYEELEIFKKNADEQDIVTFLIILLDKASSRFEFFINSLEGIIKTKKSSACKMSRLIDLLIQTISFLEKICEMFNNFNVFKTNIYSYLEINLHELYLYFNDALKLSNELNEELKSFDDICINNVYNEGLEELSNINVISLKKISEKYFILTKLCKRFIVAIDF